MEKIKKSFYKIFILVLVILAIFAGYSFYQSKILPNKKSVVQQTLTVYLKIYGQKNFSKQKVTLGENALDLTKKIATVITKGEGVNAYVTTINGKKAKAENKEFWAFYINGKQSTVGAGGYQLKNGDKIEWKIEKY